MNGFSIAALQHPKTTFGGVIAILAGLGLVVLAVKAQLGGQEVNGEQLALAVGLLGAGWAAVMAKDGDKSNAPLPERATSTVPKGFASTLLLAALAIGLGLALAFVAFAPRPARAADATAGTVDGAGIADAVAQAAPDLRGGLVLSWLPGSPSLAPAVAISPFAVSLKDGSWSSGLTVGAGYQLLWNATAPTARGIAAYANMRSTSDGPRPLVSVLGVFTPYLGAGIGYQVGGGLASFRDSAVLLLSVGTNFGAPATR
jgi:opacity protein-like surface antigen